MKPTFSAGVDRVGGLLGAGSGLSVRRAVARGGQIVRVVFSAEPKHKSPAAVDDGLNPANYVVVAVTGDAEPLRTVCVYPTLVTFPAFGLQAAGECALDVQTDRPVVVGLLYLVTVRPWLVSAVGGAVGYPYSADFSGAAVPARYRQQRRQMPMTDFASSPFYGGIIVDSTGDWATHSGIDATKKRCFRRVLTQKGSFASLPGYGVGFDVKAPATTARLTAMRTELASQIQQEPDVVKAQTAVTMNAGGYLRIDLTVQTADNQEIPAAIVTGDQGVTTT